jgi:hypothetical protein
MENYSNICKIYLMSKKEMLDFVKSNNIENEYDDFKSFYGYNKFSFPMRKFLISRSLREDLKSELKNLYNGGYGMKTISSLINITPSNTRELLKLCGVELRLGYNVITDKLRETRRRNAISQKENKNGFFRKDVRDSIKIQNKNTRGVNGWYYNSSLDKWVWLRSTYEYIFAEWLTRTKQVWDVEVTSYRLEDGSVYRPDFFIYNEDFKLRNIVEIKGYYDNRSYKSDLLKNIEPEINVVRIDLNNKTITSYMENSTYGKTLRKWKKIKKENENKKNNY